MVRTHWALGTGQWLVGVCVCVGVWVRRNTRMGQSRDWCKYGTPLPHTIIHTTRTPHTHTHTTHYTHTPPQDNATASEEKGQDADALMSHTGDNHRAGFHAAAQLFTAPDSATLCSIYKHLEDALQKPRQLGVHGGEWRSGSLSQWCKTCDSDEGDVNCAHGAVAGSDGEIITAPHWSCCGVQAEGKPCTGGETAGGSGVYTGRRGAASPLLVSKEDILASAKYIKSRSPELWTPSVATRFGGLLRATKAKAAEEKEAKANVPRAYGTYMYDSNGMSYV